MLAAALVVPAIAAAESAGTAVAPLYLSGNCTSCHGTQGRPAGGMPSLAGLQPAYFIEQMKAFRDGKRPATVMHQIARGYADRETEFLADYFARQAPVRMEQK